MKRTKRQQILRHCCFLKIIALLFFSQLLYAQQSVSLPEESLESRILRIQKLSGQNIAFDHKQINDIKVPAYNAKGQTWEKALEVSLSGTNFILKKNGTSFAIVPRPVQSQKKKGSLKGKVVDEVGQTLPGANLFVVETGTATSTDLEGAFSISLNPGTYTIEISFISYQTQRITNVKIREDEATDLNTALKPDATGLKEVVINVDYDAASTEGLLMQQKRAAQMSDGISAEQISKTPDSDVAATLKRITGITTVDNKYVVVRSMGERWNTAAMDGINLPSTEAYNQNFSFDIIPTAMVESVVVSKTATPDMNASFAGGYVEIRTKDIPDKDFIYFSVSTSYNDNVTGKEVLTRQRGKYDYFGYDDGTRSFPKGLKSTDWNNPLFFEQSKQFSNDNFTTYKTTADPGSSYQFAIGKNFAIKDNNKWGFAAAAILRNEQNKLDIEHTGRGNWLDTASIPNLDWKEQGLPPVTFYDFKNKGASYNYNSTAAGMLNFGLQLGNNRLSFRNTYTHIYDNTVTRITGWNEYTGGSGNQGAAEGSYAYFYHGIIPNNDPSQLATLDKPYTDNTNYPIYQTLMQNKLEGSHKLGRTEVAWFVARTSVASDTKDYTIHQTNYNFIGQEILAFHKIYNSNDNFSRGFIESRETDYNYGASFKWSMNTEEFKNDIKLGYAGALKQNTNQQEKFFLRVDENRDVQSGSQNQIQMNGSITEWLDGSKYQPGGIGWQTRPLYQNSLYEGEVTQHAPYVMFDNRWNNKLRLVWGVRAEYFRYDLLSQQVDPRDDHYIDKAPLNDRPWQWMPSANFTYSPTNRINVRLAYNKSVIRPQFNERTGLPYFDPIANGLIYNTEMTSSVINNYDFKFEWFPGLGEIISAGLYYKNIDRPIEREGHLSNEGNLFLYNANSKNAKLRGVEFEVRKSLDFIVQNTFLEDLYINGNFTYNITQVVAFKNLYKTEEHDATYKVERPLYGQTPYAYNLGLTYEGNRLGASFLYNAKGDQYITVGYAYKGEEIQRPYAVADAQLSYKFFKEKNLQIKFNVRNLFDRIKEYYNNFNSYSVPSDKGGSNVDTEREAWKLFPGTSSKYDKDIDRVLFRARTGRIFGLSINYTF